MALLVQIATHSNTFAVFVLCKEINDGNGYVCHGPLIINEAKAIDFAHNHLNILVELVRVSVCESVCVPL